MFICNTQALIGSELQKKIDKVSANMRVRGIVYKLLKKVE